MQAVILAAGLGTRLRDQHVLPKGFIQLGQHSIIQESIQALKHQGIANIIIVTGYGAEYYQALAKDIPGVTTVFNQKFDTAGSLYSLYTAKELIKEDFLLLESDIIYESRAITALRRTQEASAILLSGATQATDEVYVEAKNNQLIRMSKVLDTLHTPSVLGEFVGINKLSLDHYQHLLNLLDADKDLLNDGHYEENGLVTLAQQRPIYCLKIPDLLWCEIDDAHHLQRAKSIHGKINMQRPILLNPGPVTTSQTVKEALQVPDICHREREFTDLICSIRRDLLKVVNAKEEDYTSVLFASSGTGAIEACISSVIPPHKTLAVINNGAYGQRMVEIAKRYQINVLDLKISFDEPINFIALEKILSEHDTVTALAMVHHETSSGLLNPLSEIGALCHKKGYRFIVDAMSSYAGVEIDVYEDHIDYLMSSSNKCVHGMPGIAFVIAQRQALAKIKGNARSYYFDLHQQWQALESSGEMPFTPPVQVAYALRRALDELFEETVLGRIARYRRLYTRLLNGVKALGFKNKTPENRESQLLMTLQFPDETPLDFDQLHDALYRDGYTIYPKKLAIPNSFRLACIGELTTHDIDHFLETLEKHMTQENTEYGS